MGYTEDLRTQRVQNLDERIRIRIRGERDTSSPTGFAPDLADVTVWAKKINQVVSPPEYTTAGFVGVISLTNPGRALTFLLRYEPRLDIPFPNGARVIYSTGGNVYQVAVQTIDTISRGRWMLVST